MLAASFARRARPVNSLLGRVPRSPALAAQDESPSCPRGPASPASAQKRSGRYDRSKPLKSNVDITPPIMSRFDLMFVLVDECNDITDYSIAHHIVNVHTRRETATPVDFSKDRLQR